MVYGPFRLQIENARLDSLVKRVLLLSCLAGFLVIISACFTAFARDDTIEEYHLLKGTGPGEAHRYVETPSNKIGMALIAMVFGLMVPCCGYWGARNNDRNLTFCFCGCNCLGGCLNIILICSMGFTLLCLTAVQSECRPVAGEKSNSCPAIMETCSQMGKKYSSYETCFAHLNDDIIPTVTTVLFIGIAFRSVAVLLECSSFVWGKKLYDELGTGIYLHESESEFEP
eukprot:TRINITY_DN79745_c0_g1_i1.p1 TRINITY_DN79745_c0_g1~~TRINITY_DN79745_c0_g1_i1.p1  ORF type:complete len:250 (+),score=28.60 TRINITY_DN79745_c0_g1_i1:69-752(+)